MKKHPILLFLFVSLICSFSNLQSQTVYKQYQPIVLDFAIDATEETASYNPFTNYRLQVGFTHQGKTFSVPGFYAADGNAAETSAASGGIWRVIFTPNKAGDWKYFVSFKKGDNIAVEDDPYIGEEIDPHHGKVGTLRVVPTFDNAKGFEKSGRLTYANSHYLYTEDGHPFLKFGANSPENFLAFQDIDGTYSYDSTKLFLKSWAPHFQDWKHGDPTWKEGEGKGIIGALNFLASKGMNAVYALTLNIEGDARDVWPFISHEKKDFKRYDVSKLAQWDIIFSHAEQLGIVMHLITQEKENELILDDGNTQLERKLYYRELIARFAYHKNIIWNMGEENGGAPFWRQGQNDQQRFAMIRYLKDHDPYNNPIVIHTHSEVKERDQIITSLLGFDRLDGLSMQVANVFDIHHEIKTWINRAQQANRPWIIMMDEIGPWHTGTRTDADDPTHDTLRQEVLWGTLMAGGTGVEWYFGWHKPPNDLNTQDWRSRNNIWEQTAHAKAFFEKLPFTEMRSLDDLLSASNNYCFAKPGEIYAIYLKKGDTTKLDLRGQPGEFEVFWYNPRGGGDLQKGALDKIQGGSWVEIGIAPTEWDKDWAVLVKKKKE